ncbi:MAG: HAD-IC family P-type ATPase [Erysipelotrichaceae bacterium]
MDAFMKEYGLSQVEVSQRVANHQTNIQPKPITKTTKQIIKDNIISLFNLYNLAIMLLLLSVGAYKNIFFFGIVIMNTGISIVQEWRAKVALEKLTLLSTPYATLVRDHKLCHVKVEDIVLGDCIRYQAGDQIVADAMVVLDSVEVNEALLTGESDSIIKSSHSHLLSGSFVISGCCYAIVEHVGADNFASRLAQQAKTYKHFQSSLLDDMNAVVRFSSYFVLPFGLLLFARSMLTQGLSYSESIIATSAALLGMLPKGLILLTTVSLVIAIVKLSQKKILIQELYSIEMLARVDTICFDKTGTLTKGEMQVHTWYPLEQINESILDLLGSYLGASQDQNATMLALRKAYQSNTIYQTKSSQAFSSERKYSSIDFFHLGMFYLGAYDVLLSSSKQSELAKQYEQQGYRTLLFARNTSPNTPEKMQPLALFILQDPLRDHVEELLSYFSKEGIAIKILSGDGLTTVQSIANQAGIPFANSAIDARSLASTEALTSAAVDHSVFARVSPDQKKALIQAWQAQGHVVAMSGDGVNDVLALKQADCSIAMACGSSAASQISQVVLLDSDFTHVPNILQEGRRVINNIERSASLFLVKTTYSFLLTLASIVLGFAYPFIPIQLSLISNFIEGFPAFFLNLEPNNKRVSGRFLRIVLHNTLPTSILIVFDIIIIQLWIAPLLQLPATETTTLCFYVMGFCWLMQLFHILRPITLFHACLWLVACSGFYVSAYLLRDFIELTILSSQSVIVLAWFVLFTYPLQLGLEHVLKPLFHQQ